jgi:hypothetical protein
MDNTENEFSYKLDLAQIAWVVKDIERTKTFFGQTLSVSGFSETVTTRLKEYDATYYGAPSDAENLVAMTYSEESLLNSYNRFQAKVFFRII